MKDIKLIIKKCNQGKIASGFQKTLWNFRKDEYTSGYCDTFLNTYRTIGEALMLITTEIAEAMEAYRLNDIDNFTEEMADIFIRWSDLIEDLEITDQVIQRINIELIKNQKRGYRHGNKQL